MELEALLQHIKTLIDHKDEIQAKAQLLDVLQRDPDNVQGWWLASQLAETEEDTRLLLEKVLNLNPSHPQALRELKKLIVKQERAVQSTEALTGTTARPNAGPNPFFTNTPVPTQAPTSTAKSTSQSTSTTKSTSQTAKSSPASGAQPSPLALVVYQYQQKGWKIQRADKNQQAVISKMTGISWTVAIIIAAIVPVFGWILLLSNLFLHREREIFLKQVGNTVEVSGAVPRRTLDMKSLQGNNLPTPDIQYLRAFGFGTGLLVMLCIGFVGLIYVITPEDDSLAIGTQVYLVQDVTVGGCVALYANPEDYSPQEDRYPLGYLVEIAGKREIDDVMWYQLKVASTTNVIGWVDENKVAKEEPLTQFPLNFCQ